MRLGTVYLEVAESALPALIEFYRDRLGLAVASEEPGHSVWFNGSGVQVGFHAAESSLAEPGMVNLSFDVADCDAEAARLQEAGVAIAQGPMEAPWGPFRVAVVFDPVGHPVWLSGPAEAAFDPQTRAMLAKRV
jgi:predicted enzyme related to lactoylglutathione lyase